MYAPAILTLLCVCVQVGPLLVAADASMTDHQTCDQFLVNGAHSVPDESFTASGHQPFHSTHGSYAPSQARLDNKRVPKVTTGSWTRYSETEADSYIQVRLTYPSIVQGVVTQGGPYNSQWVKTYRVLYSMDGVTWYTAISPDDAVEFKGNVDSSSKVTNYFRLPIVTRHVRIKPLTVHNAGSMRFDVIGCSISAHI